MDFGAVRAFLAAAQRGQFQEAAAELAITQQAVSKRIAALEAELGVRLFTRTARGVRLTSGGQAFLPHARAVLAAVERAAAAVLDEPLQFLTGPRHALADARWLTPAGLAGHRIWMPANVAGTEWATFYEELAAAFGLAIDTSGPNFGPEHLLAHLSASSGLGTFAGEQTRLAWADGQDLRRIPLRDPVPVYPHWLSWKSGNSHPGLAALREHLARRRPAPRDGGTWAPSWA